MNILYLVHRIPYPPNRGDKIRSFHEMKYLSQRHNIDLACLIDDQNDLSHVDELKKYCKNVVVDLIKPKMAKLKNLFYLPIKKPLSVVYFYSKKIQKTVDCWLSSKNYNAIICLGSPMAEYIFNSKNLRPTTKLIMDFVDVDSDKWLQYAKHNRWPFSWIYKLENQELAKYEKKIASFFHYSVFVSKNEAQLFKKQNPDLNNILDISNGVDLEYFNPNINHHLTSQKPITNNQQPILLFTGTMDYYANVDGVVWFCQNVFPQIRQRFPQIKFYIVGRNPAARIKKLASRHIVVTGYVEDVRPYYQMATLYVAPLLIARGIQNKILEAMAMAKPVVATSKAFEGIEAQPRKDLLVAKSQSEFVEYLVYLLQNKQQRQTISHNARRTMEKYYSWQYNMEKFERILI